MHLDPFAVTTDGIAIYAGIVSTASLLLGINAFQKGGPVVDVDWEYLSDTQRLSVIVRNTGRGDVTITDVEAYLVDEGTPGEVIDGYTAMRGYWRGFP